jgi:uncharacterized caspase-like protein
MSSTRSALVVATDRYDDPKLARLRAPRRDAQALAEVLRDPAIGGFAVDLALNCREGEVRRRLSRFFADRGRDDLLLVHFSCHGLKNESGGLYFAAPDTEVAHLDVTSVSAELVDRLMTQSRSRRIVLLLDCCYGGAFGRGLGRRAGESVDVQEPLSGSGRVVLTASNAMEYSYEGDELHGQGSPSVFTAALVRGLRTGEADLDGDQQVSVDELYDYVYEAVRRDTPHMTPSRFGLVEGRLIIARNPRSPAAAGALAVAPAPTTAVREPRRAIATQSATTPIVVVAAAGILVALSSVLGFYGDKNLFQLFDVITGGTVWFALAGTLGCGLAAAGLAVLSRDPRAALAVAALGGAAFGATIGGLDYNYVNYFDASLSDLEGKDMPTGIELALVAAPVLWGAGLWLLFRRTAAVDGPVRRWDVVAAAGGVLLGLLLLLQALGVGDELVLGALLLPLVAAAPVVALALRIRSAWPRAVVMSLGAAGASYGLVALAAYGLGDLVAIALPAVIAVAGAASFRERTG